MKIDNFVFCSIMIDTTTVVDNLMRLHIFTGSQTKLTGKIKSYPYTKRVGICIKNIKLIYLSNYCMVLYSRIVTCFYPIIPFYNVVLSHLEDPIPLSRLCFVIPHTTVTQPYVTYKSNCNNKSASFLIDNLC